MAAGALTTDNGKPKPIPSQPKGSFKVVGETGVAAQHIALVTPTKMLIIDKAEANPAKLPSGTSAYNVEYDLVKNQYRVLEVKTNTFCSGGGFLPNGTMISAGGAELPFATESGFQSLRMWNPCNDGSCGWIENPADPAWTMTGNRWYVSITTLPSGELFVLGGSNESLAINRMATNNPTWEIYPKPAGVKAADYKPTFMQFMVDALPNNLYPNVYSLPDGNIYIFANQKSIIFNVERNEVIKRLPDIPGGPRSYPLTGSHVLLPLDPAKNYAHEILVCGGSEAQLQRAKALQSCGRINLNDPDPQWEMEEMPTPRLMGDAVILADGKIMLLNGCMTGYAGFRHGNDPVFTPVVYDPAAPLGSRFTEWEPSNIARMYHSVALLLPDGTVFVAGSNENSEVRLKDVPFPTEYRVESFTPPYLTTDLARPEILSKIPEKVTYAQKIQVIIDVKDKSKYEPDVTFMLGKKGFVTHSTHMSQRMIKLVSTQTRVEGTKITYEVAMPPNANLMPPGPHYIHVLNNGVPSLAFHLLLN
ncbi:glyoxal oxidase N-terminus-domain-containing protein [Lobosporangium transversale]|uniref:Glyoxal oxidase N-terminus-domain-containing protein n=1 Tax=Lobosporangium transversale TaxID=64571 RepID=A0A1Y2H1B7_9FUNG|nr:glyoxal oxidase N-terminus-domain-containing protein [Lobosporangium transversale]ORZ28325.1 glyoxal oxidase N-terminus-domain-containing protein [Lobosporangium transversale]|eukprot:XP_021886010.1 glyoxal oxidase N-terminus-domain-containing protein [Lobosporangium transversale]